MSKKMWTLLLAAVAVVFNVSCCDQSAPEQQKSTKGRLTLTVQTDVVQSKVIDAQTGQDETLNSLDVFIFNNNQDSRQGELDAHFTLPPDTLVNNSISLTVTQGSKVVYVMANAKQINGTDRKISWTGVTNLDTFLAQTVSLANEEIGNYFMWGMDNSVVSTTGVASIELARLISRIKLNALQTDFSGSAYEGTTLTDVRAYLVNVTGNRTIVGGTPVTPVIFNSAARIAADLSAMRITNGLAEELGTIAPNAPMSTARYLYAYANTLTQESVGHSFTRLVIEAKFSSDGDPVYYPINIPNLEGNATYSYSVTIKRPGTLNPDTPITYGALDLTLTITPWNENTNTPLEF